MIAINLNILNLEYTVWKHMMRCLEDYCLRFQLSKFTVIDVNIYIGINPY